MTKRRSRSRSAGKKNTPRRGWALLRLWLVYGLLLAVALLGIWTLYLDHKVRQKFEGKKWALPARVYAQPLELYEGMDLTSAAFEQELRSLGYRFVSQVQAPGQVSKRVSSALSATVYQLHSRGFVFWDKQERAQRFNVRVDRNQVVALEDMAGVDLPLVRLEPQEIGGFYPEGHEDRVLVRLADLPPLLGETLLAVEDKHFLDHHGVSPLAIARAAWVNLRSGDVVQGGSTITQQLVKNFYLSNEQRFFQRKVPEAIMSLLLEAHYSKAEILETYINEVFLGQSGGRAIHGFALGAQHYFRQPLNELDVQELALLVGLVKGASYYNPWRNPERARDRRNVVLDVMHREGLIDSPQLARAKAAPLGIVEQGQVGGSSYPGFLSLVKRQLREDYREEDLRSEGLRIFTSFSPRAQRAAEAALAQRVAALAKSHKQPQLQGAMVVTSVGTGEVLALVGDKDPRFDGFNRALDAKRQIGSLMKPFVYLTAWNSPQQYHLGSIISDEPVSYKSGANWWVPQNADKRSHGDVPLYGALAHSYNQATARLGMNMGLPRVVKTLQQAGFNGRIDEVPSLLLGAVEMSPFEVAGVYHTLAADGVYAPLHAIREVLAADGKPLKRFPLELQQRFSPQVSFLLQEALHRAITEGTGRRVLSQLPANARFAGKTGTTNDQRDSWFAGFSGEHVAVVWLGRDDNQSTPFSGSSGALQVWGDFMAAVNTRGLEAEPPPGINMIWLDKASGKRTSAGCVNAAYLPVIAEFEPMQAAPCAGAQSNPIKDLWQRLRQ